MFYCENFVLFLVVPSFLGLKKSKKLLKQNQFKSLGSIYFSFCLKTTGGSVGWALVCHAGGCEFYSSRTNTQGL